jgi:LysM repeat protein
MGLNDLIPKLSKSGDKVLAKNLIARVTKVQEYLLGLTEIRIFTANSQQFGHQASSVNILRNLIRMGAPGPYTLILSGRTVKDAEELEEKIALLIPQFKAGDTTFTLNERTVNVVLMYPGTENLPLANFAINGGFDDLEGKTVPFSKLNVINYVQLQPYAWHRGTNMVRVDQMGLPDIINLDESTPGAYLQRRAFYLDPILTESDWTAMEEGQYKEQVSVCKYLLGELDASRIFLVPGYGFGTKGGGWSNLYNMVAGVRQSQKTITAAQKATVIVAIGVSQSDWSIFTDILLLGEGRGAPPTPNFTTFHDDSVWDFVSYAGSGNQSATLQKTKDELAKIVNDPQQVLVVFLNRIPGPLFDQLYKRASLPPLFEGQNTTELMLNFGKSYLKISSNQTDTMYGYPTLPLNSLASGTQALDAQSRAFNGIPASWPDSWYSDRPTYPPAQLPPVTSAYLTRQGDTLAKYFENLGKFFHDELNDKLLRGLDLFVNVIGPGGVATTELVMKKTEAVQVNVVEALYQQLLQSTHDGVLNLLQAITVGDIYDFFADVVADSVFRITEANPQLNPEKTVCTLVGNTKAFGLDIGATELVFEFTDDNDTGRIRTVFGAKFSAKWALPGADWLSIADPGFNLTMGPVADVPFMAAMTARVTAGLTADMTLTVPIAPGIFQLQAVFVKPRPSITNIFQLVGGINLQQYLPSQLQLLTDIEVETFTTRYNYEQGSVDLMGASLRTPPGKTWKLVPAVVVNQIAMNVSVVSPGDRLRRKTSFDITGDFGIAEATAYITAYAPQLRVMGGLRDDSKPLDVKAIVKTYLGEEFVAVLPSAIASAQISRLAFMVDQAAGRYSFGMTVDTIWEIPTGSPIFTVTQLGFDIQATSRAIDTPAGQEGRTVVVIGNETSAPGPSNTEITGSFSGNITVDTSATDKAQISVIANYLGSNKGWTFTGKQIGGEVNLTYLLKKYLNFDVPPEYNYALDGLSLTTATADGSWAFTAKTKEPWKVPFIPLPPLSATLAAGYNPPKKSLQLLPVLDGTSAAISLASVGGCDNTGNFARIEVKTRWNNIELMVWYDYCGSVQSFGITWDFIEALVKQEPNKDWIGVIRFTKGTTLGGIIERMVTWLTGSAFALEAPWSVLNSIPLNNLSLEYNFTKNTVSFNLDIGPINLGIARIDSISVVYENDTSNPQSKKGVFVTLKGSFIWNTGATANGNANQLGPWDTSKPGTAPAPPGNGNKYLDLRLLAMGQHVTASCFATAKNVQAAIDCLASLPDTKPGETPKIMFDPQSSWLIGTEFGILKFGDEQQKPAGTALAERSDTSLAAPPPPKSGYLFTLQIVFNDPHLYALRIALAGPAAKIFKGLDFQIMYRQISDSVGVYQAEITLPDIMRNLSIGAYSLTLPVFGIAIYTNGDFQVDVGFPWNEDFTRSFTIEGIVYPGIPLLGSAGFYFGKLSSATTNKVPAVTNGTFNPVIVFGFGVQFGVGKSIRYGVLSAGFSITVFGIIEGVLGKWNPYQLTDGGTSDDSQLQGAYYFWLRGTIGIIGKVFGTVDFAIIKADVSIEVKVMVQLTYESYQSITLTIVAFVSVSVSISIDLGLFSIKISFSFSMRLKETFTIENSGKPPWTLAAPAPTLLRAPADKRLRSARMSAAAFTNVAEGVNWDRLANSTNKIPLEGYFVPALTAAHDEWDKDDKYTEQTPCYVGVIAIKSVAPPSQQALISATMLAAADDTSFEKLAKMILRWAIAAKQESSVTWEDIDGKIVNAETLQTLIDIDLNSTDANPTPIPPEAANEFMRRQFRLTVSLPPTNGSSDTTFFPVAPDLTLNVNAWNNDPPYGYQFGKYNELGKQTLADLRKYFDELAVKVQQEQGTAPKTLALEVEKPLSMADWILSDYFLLIARQMVQAARDALRQFKYSPSTTETPNDIINWINTTGDLQGDDKYFLFELFAANPTHPLNGSKTLTVSVHAVADAEMPSFEMLAKKAEQNLGAYTSADLALANAAAPGILQAGKTVKYSPNKSYTIKDGDSLLDIAKAFSVTLADLLINSDVLLAQVLRDKAAVLIPYITYRALADDTFDKIAKLAVYANGFDAKTLATQNAGRPILQSGVKVVYTPTGNQYTTVSNDTLATVASALGITLAQLFSGTDVLVNARLIAPVAVIFLPSFNITTVKKETLEGIIQRFAISMNVLSFATTNGDQAGLFLIDNDNLHLDIPHLAQFQVGELIKEAQRSLVIQQLSGMAACYYLHGLRLPTTGIKPMTSGIWVKEKDKKLVLPDYAGVYALTGQQIKVPVIPNVKDTPPFVITLDRSAGPDWLLFPNTQQKLTVSIAYDSTDAERIRKVAAFVRTGAIAIPLSKLGAGVMYESDLARYPFASSLLWQSAAVVDLPYGGNQSGGVPSLRIWRMPDAMINLARAIDKKSSTPSAKLPRFSINLARYDEATGTTVPTAVTSYGWASTIQFTVKRVPEVATSSSNKTTYELVGASGNSILVLERIIEQVRGNDSFFDQIIVGYSPEQTGDATEGVQTDAPGNVTLGIAQVNLSTITRPSQGLATMLASEAERRSVLLNTPSEFLQLLWTASITRAGGFYLYYYDSGGKRGLPDRIFNDRGEATLVLIVTYSAPESDFDRNRLTNFMNAVAIGEAVETSNAIVFAQADPPQLKLSSNNLGSLDSIGYDYYTDLGDLAEANASVALTSGKKIIVNEGLYQPPPGPGVPLSKITTDFSTTLDALKTANPRYQGTLPDPVVFPTALNLPRLELIVGTSASSGSFAGISSYYGQGIASLAADVSNRSVSPIFAANQQVIIPGGPRSRTSTVPPGAQTLLAKCSPAPTVPLDPNAQGYPEAFIYNNFSLLNYSVAKNLYFDGSHIGLPAGPTSKPAKETNDKIVIPTPLEEVEEWDYKQSLPYPSFAITTLQKSAEYLPAASESPYLGVGYILQIEFSWQDYYGNTLVTTLTSPSAGKPPYDQPPLRTGYSDLLIGLSQWPSIASSFQVDTVGGKPALQLLLTFDASRYEGLLSARMSGATSVIASFTQPLDRDSAEKPVNYKIEGGVITQATLTDPRTVTLAVASLDGEQFVLTINNVESEDKKLTFSGQATFTADRSVSSTLNQNAQTALRTYQQLFYQLSDPNGVAYAVESSLIRNSLPLTAEQITSIKQWLFDGEQGKTSIYQFIADRAAWKTEVLPPPNARQLDFAIDPQNLNQEQVFLLLVSFVVRRTGGAVLGDLETMPGITRAATEIAPYFARVSIDEKTVGLTQFATLFQNALSVQGSYRMKIATGVDRRSVTTARNGSVLWVVRIGVQQDAQEPISYKITNAGSPAIFAPQPISNELQTRRGVTISTYETGKGLTGPQLNLDFANIDMDVWGRQFFAAVDGVLTPEFTSATQIVGQLRSQNYLQQLLDQKKLLAVIAKQWMIPAFEDEAGTDTTRVQEAYYQQMLTTLSSAYTTRAAVEYRAVVNATINDPGFQITPRLFGPVTFASPRIISATSTDENLSVVFVAFSAPMDNASATNPANYTVSAEIQVASATISDDGLVVTLALSAPIVLGTSTVTVAFALKDRRGRTIRPPLTVIIRHPADVRDAASEITFSSPKLDLKVASDAAVPFLVIAPENVRGGGGEIVASLNLDLVYNGTDIEHQISRPEGVEGYVASTWLSFVIRDEDWSLEQPLGAATVPMPLRSFPLAPAMSAQMPVVNPDAPDLAALTKWAYDFTYVLPVHYPHDRVLCDVEFNINANSMLLAQAELLNAFNELAQFITVFPRVNQDLIQFLGMVDATTDSGSDDVKNAGVALETAIKMIRYITDKAEKSGGLVMQASQVPERGDPALKYSFYIQECSVKAEGDPRDGALLVTLVGKRPDGIGLPWVKIGDPEYHPERYHGNDCSNNTCDDVSQFCFVYADKDGQYLSAEKGQTISDRTVELPDLDLFQRQNAQATTKIKRNVELVPGRVSAGPFIYTTSDVTFANALQPTVDSSHEYDIASLGSSVPVKRSLFEQLKNLFNHLLQHNDQPTLTLQVEVTYDYVLNAALPAVPLPILMQPPMAVAVKGAAPEATPLDDVLTAWSDGIRNWFQTNLPLGTSGKLHFNLTLMTNLVQPPMPLLWTRNLDLGLEWIEPALPTR